MGSIISGIDVFMFKFGSGFLERTNNLILFLTKKFTFDRVVKVRVEWLNHKIWPGS